MPISGAIPSAAGLIEGSKQCPVDVALLIPSIISELAGSPELLEYCASNMELILYCGGDLPQAIGDAVASKIRLANQYGASEMSMTAQVWSHDYFERSEWKYVRYHPIIGYEMREADGETYELVVVRDENRIGSQPSFTIFPEISEYASRDLFTPHPSKPDLWRWVARRDDIVVFLNGEKTNPISMEQHVMQRSSKIRCALVAGAQRFQAALIIEPVTTEELSVSERAAHIEELWPIIEEANEDCPAHAKISKSHILITRPSKPMVRTGKGTVQRFATYTLYSQELDALYKDAEAIKPAEGELEERRKLTAAEGEGNAEGCLRDFIFAETKIPNAGADTNLFTAGMDSLQAISLTRYLRRTFALKNIDLNVVYTNPSIRALSKALYEMSSHHDDQKKTYHERKVQIRKDLMSRYCNRIDALPLNEKPMTQRKFKKTVLLTGSAGTLGSYVLDLLKNHPDVERIYCLNRTADSHLLQSKRNKDRGLEQVTQSERIVFLSADLAKPHFGLSNEIYAKLHLEATTIIHNAWPVNFNLSLEAFDLQFRGMENLIFFTASAPHSPHLFYISSIGSVMSIPPAKIPEQVIEADIAPTDNGYAESK